MYGEGDSWIVPHALRLCKQYGYLQQFGPVGDSLMQFTYAGNVASMHLAVADLLLKDAGEFGGEVFNCNENTRPINYYKYIQPFIENAGYKLSSFTIPYLVAITLFLFLELVFHFFALFGIRFTHNLPSKQMVMIVAGLYFHFSTKKAHLILDFKPPYDPDESMKRAIEWWRNNYNKPYPGFSQKQE